VNTQLRLITRRAYGFRTPEALIALACSASAASAHSYPNDPRKQQKVHIICGMFDSRRVSSAALLLLPAGLIAYAAFNAGAFYPGPPAYIAVVLALVLFIRAAGAGNPLEGVGVLLSIGAAMFGVYALWTLISEHWSHAPGLALVEFDRALLYLLVMVLFGAIRHTRFRMIWILRVIASAIGVVCTCALVTRLLPHVWPTNPNLANNRLSYPITYWNVLGLLAALGLVLCVHLTSDERRARAARRPGPLGRGGARARRHPLVHVLPRLDRRVHHRARRLCAARAPPGAAEWWTGNGAADRHRDQGRVRR